MAYLRWSWSPWYAFSHADGGEGDDAVLVAWHERGAGASVTAGELFQAGCEVQPDRLRDFLADRFNRLADGATPEQILQAFPAISQNAACDALREAALLFPLYASFQRAVEVWTPRYP